MWWYTGLALLGVGILLYVWWFRARIAAPLKASCLRSDRMANLVGTAPEWQGIRGNGGLYLRRDGVFFRMYFPPMKIDVPLGAIGGVDTCKSYLMKASLIPMLRVHYRDSDNQISTAVWTVRDAKAWVRDIEALRN